MSELVKCATCKTEKPFSEMQTCMHADREHSVCDMTCMINFYKGKIKPDIVITPDLEEMGKLGMNPKEYHLHKENLKLSTQLAKANERVKELEKELTLSTDQNDLLLDEFIRVKYLTDNTEIHALCERANVRMRQNVSVIDRNHKLERKVIELKQRCAELDEIADTAFKYNHSSAQCLRAWNKLQQLRKEQE